MGVPVSGRHSLFGHPIGLPLVTWTLSVKADLTCVKDIGQFPGLLIMQRLLWPGIV